MTKVDSNNQYIRLGLYLRNDPAYAGGEGQSRLNGGGHANCQYVEYHVKPFPIHDDMDCFAACRILFRSQTVP